MKALKMNIIPEILTVRDILKILDFMSQHFQEKVEDAGMDFGGDYEVMAFQLEKDKVDKLISDLEESPGSLIENIPVHFQLCKINHQKPAFNLHQLQSVLNQFYDIQDQYLKKVHNNMTATRLIMEQLERCEQYVDK